MPVPEVMSKGRSEPASSARDSKASPPSGQEALNFGPAVQAMDQLETLLGIPEECRPKGPGSEPEPSTVERALADVASRLPDPTAFAHGAKLLAKDVRLLGEVLGDHPAFRAFDQAATPFLDQAQT